MKRFVPSILIVLTLVSTLARATERRWLTSVDEATAAARGSGQRIFVDLYADWCGWCKRLEEDVFSTPEFQEFAGDLVLLRVDTEDGSEGTRLQERFEAYSLPTTLIVDQDLVRIAEAKGYAPAARYISLFQREIKVFGELIEGYERFRDSDDPRVLGILADELHRRNDGERAARLYRQMLTLSQIREDQQLRIRFQLSDALRLDQRYDEALEEVSNARQQAARIEDHALVQRFDLLVAQVSIDRGDCEEARTALQGFLGAYPSSNLTRAARHTLRTLAKDGYQCM
jgi:thioredoxin-related protein